MAGAWHRHGYGIIPPLDPDHVHHPRVVTCHEMGTLPGRGLTRHYGPTHLTSPGSGQVSNTPVHVQDDLVDLTDMPTKLTGAETSLPQGESLAPI